MLIYLQILECKMQVPVKFTAECVTGVPDSATLQQASHYLTLLLFSLQDISQRTIFGSIRQAHCTAACTLSQNLPKRLSIDAWNSNRNASFILIPIVQCGASRYKDPMNSHLFRAAALLKRHHQSLGSLNMHFTATIVVLALVSAITSPISYSGAHHLDTRSIAQGTSFRIFPSYSQSLTRSCNNALRPLRRFSFLLQVFILH